MTGARSLCDQLRSDAQTFTQDQNLPKMLAECDYASAPARGQTVWTGTDTSRVFFAPEIKDGKCCGLFGCGSDAPADVMQVLRDREAVDKPVFAGAIRKPWVSHIATWGENG